VTKNLIAMDVVWRGNSAGRQGPACGLRRPRPPPPTKVAVIQIQAAARGHQGRPEGPRRILEVKLGPRKKGGWTARQAEIKGPAGTGCSGAGTRFQTAPRKTLTRNIDTQDQELQSRTSKTQQAELEQEQQKSGRLTGPEDDGL